MNPLLNIFRKKQPGFTFVELTIVFTIFIALATIFVTSQQQARRSSSLRIASDTTQSVLRQMQNNVLSGELYSESSLTPARDYGIKFLSGGASYTSFVEEAATSNYKALETVNFDQKITFTNATVLSGGVSQGATSVEIRFFPPYGEIRVTAKSGSTTLFTEAKNVVVTFRLSYSGTSQYRQITVDGLSGRISEF